MIAGIKARLKNITSRIASFVIDADAHNIPRLLQRRALEQTVDFVASHMPMVTPYETRFDLIAAALEQAVREGLYCEFGVFAGEAINFIARRISRLTIHGFDSFEGLPEDWRPGIKAGHFKLQKLPTVESNVKLVKGWFNESLPGFLNEHPEPVSFLHIDSDLYSSAKTVLNLMASRIHSGTVIIFDEYFNYDGWQQGEFKAFQEFVADYGVRFEYIGYSACDEQVAVVIREISANVK